MKKKLKIPQKLRGADDYEVFSVRLERKLLDEVEKISYETNRSRNNVISILIKYGVENYEEED